MPVSIGLYDSQHLNPGTRNRLHRTHIPLDLRPRNLNPTLHHTIIA
jgi:hypothetical protein